MAQVIRRTVDNLSLAAAAREVSLTVQLAAEGLASLRADANRIAQVLRNLMVNALEAMSQGDKLAVSVAKTARRSDHRPREFVRIDITDTGEGIAAEALERIFDPFFTTKASGTGLGLAIVYSTVTRHGGEVTVQSAPGHGTAFSILLPAMEAQNMAG